MVIYNKVTRTKFELQIYSEIILKYIRNIYDNNVKF